MLDNKSIDFAISTFTQRPSRRKVVDYMVVNTKPSRGYIYVKNPKETFDWEVYGQPLWQAAWIGVVLFCMLVPILMAIVVVDRELYLQASLTQFDY